MRVPTLHMNIGLIVKYLFVYEYPMPLRVRHEMSEETGYFDIFWNHLRNEFVTLSYRRVGVLMETNLSLFWLSSLGGGGRVSDPICTMSRYLPFLGFEGSPKIWMG